MGLTCQSVARRPSRISCFMRSGSLPASGNGSSKDCAAGVMLYHGKASFVDPHTIRFPLNPPAHDCQPVSQSAGDVLLQGDIILIATGSSPVRPPGFPFDHDRVHDSDEVLQLERLPRSMAVIGAGVIGCEYACTFAALGTKIWIIDGPGNCCRSSIRRSRRHLKRRCDAGLASSSSGTARSRDAWRPGRAISSWRWSRAARCLWMACW